MYKKGTAYWGINIWIMKTSERGIELIKKFEDFRSEAYKCPAGVWTIGYGHTGGVKPGDRVTETEAEGFLRKDVESSEKIVLTLVKKPINQNQFDALVSFVYNTGSGNFAGSTLLRKINSNPQDEGIKKEFQKWVYAKGVKLPGLVSRREKESNLYFSPL